jgi:hypothetical protein
MTHFLLAILRKTSRFMAAMAMGVSAYLGIGLIWLAIELAATIVLIPIAIVFFLLGAFCMLVTFLVAVASGAPTTQG